MNIRAEDVASMDFSDVADVAAGRLPPIHPGEILLEEFLKPMGISQYALAKAIEVHPRRVNEIVHGLRGISADTALRLAAFFGSSAEFWLSLQRHYDLETARAIMQGTLERIQQASTMRAA